MKEICLTKPYFKEDKIVRREKNIAEIMNNYFINITNERERTKWVNITICFYVCGAIWANH